MVSLFVFFKGHGNPIRIHSIIDSQQIPGDFRSESAAPVRRLQLVGDPVIPSHPHQKGFAESNFSGSHKKSVGQAERWTKGFTGLEKFKSQLLRCVFLHLI